CVFFFQAEDGIRDWSVTGVQTCALPISTVDWISYPILDITETPSSIETVLIDHPEIAPSGAGEPSIRPVAAAIANAIFDATGVRMRRVPFTPDRVREAMA